MPLIFDEDMVRSIFRKSENVMAPAKFNNRDVIGHTGKKHSAITNKELSARYEETANNDVALYLAFKDFAQAVSIGTVFLNHPRINPKVQNLYEKGREGNSQGMGEPGKGGKPADDGGRLSLECKNIDHKFDVRLINHKGAFPTQFFTMRLQKKIGNPSNLFIVTFFPSIPLTDKAVDLSEQ